MEIAIICLLTLILSALYLENRRAASDRKLLSHVIYINGTRGKSTVTRLIDAGLREGGVKVLCKTTGTVPMTIDVDGTERVIMRRGRANIKEQLWVLRRAVSQKADILVAECMAVDPFLQKISQQRMMRSDIGVITNVRLDHTEEMGGTLSEICDSLCNTIPTDGVVFTAECEHFAQISQNAKKKGTEVRLCLPDSDLPDIHFPQNLAIALAVCEHLGIARETALNGMAGFHRDPFDLSLHRFHNGALFINGLSVNDPNSTEMVFHELSEKRSLASKRLILLINNRSDRGYRTEHMLILTEKLSPDAVWLIGASRGIVRRRLRRKHPNLTVLEYRLVSDIPFNTLCEHDVIYAVGNIANQGHALMQRVRTETTNDE